MRFALVNNIKVEATSGSKGICPGCMQPLVARCGNQRVSHWAHPPNKLCDIWWEPETMWHRAWKNKFPTDWQEVFIPDETIGEKHFADVRTANNLVIEFQHSHIDPKERTIRERFYKNMVWVVDGTRLKRDYSRFIKGSQDFRKTDNPKIFKVNFPDEIFNSAWLDSSVPVIFDFKGLETIDNNSDARNRLYCLLPIRIERFSSIVAEISFSAFVTATLNGDWSSRVREFIDSLVHPKQENQSQLVDIRQKNLNTDKSKSKESEWRLERGRFVKRKRF